MPSPSPHMRERGSGVLNDFSCHSSLIWELESNCRTCNYMRWRRRARDLVCLQCTCTGNAIITFFTLFDPAPCDNKCRSEHSRPSFCFSGEGSGDETNSRTGSRFRFCDHSIYSLISSQGASQYVIRWDGGMRTTAAAVTLTSNWHSHELCLIFCFPGSTCRSSLHLWTWSPVVVNDWVMW